MDKSRQDSRLSKRPSYGIFEGATVVELAEERGK